MDNKFYTSYEFLIKEIRRSNGLERDCNWSGTWYRNDNVKYDPEFDGNFEADGRTGNGALKVPEAKKVKYRSKKGIKYIGKFNTIARYSRNTS